MHLMLCCLDFVSKMTELASIDRSSILKFLAIYLLGFMCSYAWLGPPAYLSIKDVPSPLLYSRNRVSDVKELQKPPGATGPSANVSVANDDTAIALPQDDRSVADKLKEKIRVLCMVPIQASNHKTRSIHVKKTWGPRCTTLVFLSTKEDKSLPTVVLPVKEGRNHLWQKIRQCFKYVYEHYAGQYDWVIKADDDTFVIMENLRYLLAAFDPNEPLFLGGLAKHKVVFMYGGSGYILSKKAVEMFYKEGLKKCNPNKDTLEEDIELSVCLKNMGVKIPETRDPLMRPRFLELNPERQLDVAHWPAWLRGIYYHKGSEKLPMSDTAVGFHKVTPTLFPALEYLIYHLRPFGLAPPAEEASVVPGGESISTILKKLFNSTV